MKINIEDLFNELNDKDYDPIDKYMHNYRHLPKWDKVKTLTLYSHAYDLCGTDHLLEANNNSPNLEYLWL